MTIIKDSRNGVTTSPAPAEVVDLEGLVCSGLGEGASFTRMHWVLDQFESKFGIALFPGTFNLELEGVEWAGTLRKLQKLEGTRLVPPDGFCNAKCFRLLIAGGLEGVLVLPEVDDYPDQKLEIVASVPVRQTLQLKDGDRVKIQLHVH